MFEKLIDFHNSQKNHNDATAPNIINKYKVNQ